MTNKKYEWWIFHAKYWVNPPADWQQNDAIIDRSIINTSLTPKTAIFESEFDKEGPFTRKDPPTKIGF